MASSGIFGRFVKIRMQQKAGRDGQGPRIAEQLREELHRQIGLLRAAGHEQTGRQRDQKRRHLADQAVADASAS